jgi:glycosyltransferase involved in cell wall biosynthesis
MRLCIAHAGDISEPSGGTDRVTAIATGLEERGHDVVVVVPEPEGSITERLQNIDVRRISSPVDNSLGRTISIARHSVAIAEEEDRQIQFEHSALAGVASLVTRNPNFILDMHDLAYSRFDHINHPLSPIMRRAVGYLERRAVENARQVVLVSETMARTVEKNWNVSKEDISVVPNGYFPDIAERFTDVEQEPGRVVFLGTLHPKVDVTLLCQVAQLDDVSELLVIGDGAQRAELEEQSRKHEALAVLGRLPDQEAFRYVASSQAVVNPQRPSALQRSSSPVKLYYYAAFGKPIVATKGPDILTELSAREAAHAVTNRSEFMTAIKDILSDDQVAETLGSNAASVATEHQWSKRVEKLATVLQRIER